METVNIHCSECSQLIGIAREDLGHHVECPLCQKVILAAMRDEPEERAGTVEPSPKEPQGFADDDSKPDDDPLMSPFVSTATSAGESDNESIFSSPEEASDDIFGSAPETPKVKMPDESRTLKASPKVPRLSLDDESAPPEDPHESPQAEHTDEEQMVTSADSLRDEKPSVAAADSAHEDPNGAHQPHESGFSWASHRDEHAGSPVAGAPAINLEGSETIRRVQRGQMLATILLIFFVPYSILSTGVIGWLWVTRESYSKDPLERMLEDQGRKPGGIQRIKHDLELPDKLRTSLQRSLRVGAVEFTPLKILLTEKGDLVLQARLRNISKDLKFNPLPAKFADPRKRPYLFLEIDQQKSASVKAYGAEVQWLKGPPEDLQPILNTSLSPNESMTVELTTVRKYRSNIEAFRKSGKPLLWRIHLRRGLERILGRDRGITCVIGVEINSSDITKA